jgi:undecaprenyl-diphosphatase
MWDTSSTVEGDPHMQVTRVFNAVDLPILDFLTGFTGKSSLFDHLMNALSRLDLFKGVVLMCLFWYVWAAAPADEPPEVREQRQKRLMLVLIGTVLMGGLSRGLQLALPIHQRPLLADLGLNFPIMDVATYRLNNWNSFPSDHGMFFFALGAGLWSVNRRVGLIVFIWSAVIIDFPRVYLGIHYPSDVVAGSLLGLVGMRLFLALPLDRVERSLNVWRYAHPGMFMALMFFTTNEIGHLLAELRDVAGISAHMLLH